METDNTAVKIVKFGKNIITNKQSRSAFFLIVSLILVLGLNSLLPVIEGSSHYTHATMDVTYGEYIKMHAEDDHVRLTWVSQQKVKEYVREYIGKHPELTPEEQLMVRPPDMLEVVVYTKFFFEHSFWWISTGVSVLSTLITFYALFNYLNTKNKSKYLKYLNLTYQMDQLVENYIDPDTFEPWVHHDFNVTRKINQHRSNVKYALDKLIRKTDYKYRREAQEYEKKLAEYKEAMQVWDASDDKTDIIPIPPTPPSKRATKFIAERDRLQSFLDEDYINNIVVEGEVKNFVYIHPMFVYGGVNNNGRMSDNYSQIITDGTRVRKDAFSKILVSLILIFVFAVLLTVTVITSVEQATFWIVLNVVAKVIPLFLQVPFAYDYRDNFMETQLLKNLQSRRTISLMYLADMKRRGLIQDKIVVESVVLTGS